MTHDAVGSAAPNPPISVVVPFYNAGRYIARCLDGLFAQSFPLENYEVILVDNNSTDDSAGIAKRYNGISLLKRGGEGDVRHDAR